MQALSTRKSTNTLKRISQVGRHESMDTLVHQHGKLVSSIQQCQNTKGHQLLFCHASLGVCSTKRRYQSPEWTILSHVNCSIQGKVLGCQVLLDSLHPCSTRASWWSPPVLQGRSSEDLLGICFVWHSCNVAERG